MIKKILVLSLSTIGAMAYASDSIYLGMAHISTHAEMAPLTGDIAFPAPGATFKVGGATTMTFGWEHHYSENWGAELVMGLPPKHKTYGDGVFAHVQGAMSESSEVCPTVFMNYHLTALSNKLVPLVGVGINYTRFTNQKVTDVGNAASGYPTTIHNSSYVGLAYQVGLEYKVTKEWSVMAKVMESNVSSDLTLTAHTPIGDKTDTTKIYFHPVVTSLVVSKSF